MERDQFPDGFEDLTVEQFSSEPELDYRARCFADDIKCFAEENYPHLKIEIDTDMLLDFAMKNLDVYYDAQKCLTEALDEEYSAFLNGDEYEAEGLRRLIHFEDRLSKIASRDALANEVSTIFSRVIQITITGESTLLVEDFYSRIEVQGLLTSHGVERISLPEYKILENGKIQGTGQYEMLLKFT